MNGNNLVSNNMQSRIIDAMRFPLAAMVVLLHSRQLEENYALPNWANMSGDDIFTIINIFFSNVFCHVAVPVFFVISGYYFFYGIKKMDGKMYVEKLKKRTRSILVPYLLWNLSIPIMSVVGRIIKGESIAEALAILKDRGIGMFWDSNVWGYGRENWLGWSMLETAPALSSLWFLRDLFVVILITPFIYVALRRFKLWALFPIAFCFISGIWPDIHGLSTISILFFSYGAYFSIHGKNMIEELKKLRIVSYVLYIPLLIIVTLLDSNNTRFGLYIYPFFIIISVWAVMNLFTQLVETGRLKENTTLIKATFFIYAAHGVFGLKIASIILSRLIPDDSMWLLMCIRYFLMPVITILVCLVVYELMKKFFPKLLRIITGRG